MNVRSIQTTPTYTGMVHHRHGRPAVQPDGQTEQQESTSTAAKPALLTTDEKSYFEQLYPESRNEVRAHQAYSGRGAQQAAPKGTLVDRKG